MRKHWDGNENAHLGDEDLLDRERNELRELIRLEQLEPHFSETTYRALEGSRALMHAWERWKMTNVAADLRGLPARGRDLR